MRKLFFLTLLALSFLTFGIKGCYENSTVTLETENGNHKFNVEVAKDALARAKGLMGRESLEENQGMLFKYSEEGNRSFWMQDTLIPLDIIFINQDLEIVSIQEAEPCNFSCKRHTSNAQYVLELNKGKSKEINLTVGDKISFKNI